jgi:transcriptional regulator with XRE-family HTH domain
MRSTVGRRVFLAHLQLSYQLGRRVTLAEFGRLIAQRLGRPRPFAATAVSKWEAGLQVPGPEIIEAIAELTGVDPGWISHGTKSAAPTPALLPAEVPDLAARRPEQRPVRPARTAKRAQEWARARPVKSRRRGK